MLARDGDRILVDAGLYVGDVATFAQRRLAIVGAPPGCMLLAGGAAAEEKAIWVVRGGDVTATGFTFCGARVRDRNGAGIRLEGGRLAIADCRFLGNECGVLTSDGVGSELILERSEFGHCGAGDGQSHSIYVGNIHRFEMSGCYVHHGNVGHLVKSRARSSFIVCNRLTDEEGGRASYEVEFPNGGFACVVGNLIQQSSSSENRTMISYGAEGGGSRDNQLHLINNTLVSDLAWGTEFVDVRTDVTARVTNNLLVGGAGVERLPNGSWNNFRAGASEFPLARTYDYRLRCDSRLVARAAEPGEVMGRRLRPTNEYVHRCRLRDVDEWLYSPGAFQSLAD